MAQRRSHATRSSSINYSLAALVVTMATSCVTAAAAAATLQFVSSSPNRPLALYRAPAPYQEPGKPALNSLIITSKPFSIGEQRGPTSTTTTTVAPLWRRHMQLISTTERPSTTLNIPQYNIDCSNGKSCSETIAVEQSTPKPTFKPYPQDVLDKFLRDFAHVSTSPKEDYEHDHEPSNYKENKLTASADDPTNRLANLYLDDSLESEESEGKTRWSQIQAQQHNHPYDDKEGWITLDPVPWSSSKVSKWHSTINNNKRPSHKPPNRWESRPPSDWSSDKPVRPSSPSSWDKPLYDRPSDNPLYDRPSFDKPPLYDRPSSEEYDKPSKPAYWSRPSDDRWGSDPTSRPPSHWNRPNEYEYGKPVYSSPGNPDIITDGRPGKWPEHQPGSHSKPSWQTSSSEEHNPHYDYSHQTPDRRPVYGGYGTEHRPPIGHPEEGEGEWVLLSSTKGYAVPHRHKIYQRALTINPTPITSRRTVRLTVLPALNGTANTTISHGGLLEVESTFQSVDEAQKQHHYQLADPVPVIQPKNATKMAALRLVTQSRPPINSRAVLAAVGAGMLPATMAVLVPMLLGRRRRETQNIAPDITWQQNVTSAKKLRVKRILKKMPKKLFQLPSKLH